MKINSEKCYLLGLLIGGGIIKSNQLQIVLPYKKWGNLKINPDRGGGIAEDILKRAGPLWKIHYNVDVSYKIDKDWKIIFSSITDELQNDLSELGLSDSGEFRENADLSKLLPLLTDNRERAREFLAGIVDTVGSLAPSHRRFTSEFQIVSLEFKGRNFGLVSSVVDILVRIGCIPDQILWNHPNQHSGQDRYYKYWKKGFKIRVALDDYLLRGSFVFETKQLSANENKKLQGTNRENTVRGKISKIEGRTAVHIDENCDWLPAKIRGYHFIHYTHLADFLGISLPNNRIHDIRNFEQYVSPFTILSKGTVAEINNIVKNEEYLNKSTYRNLDIRLSEYLNFHEAHGSGLLFGKTEMDGFPVNYILQAIAYIYCATIGKNIKGKRVVGSYLEILRENIGKINDIHLEIPDRGTCLIVANDKYSALIGYINNEFNRRLLVVDLSNVKMRSPEFLECILLPNNSYENEG